MKIGFVLTETVDGRFVPWESFLEWESYLDLYCLALTRLGMDCVKYVPSFGVRKTETHRHKFGHVVKRIPTSHPLISPSWLTRPRAYSYGHTTTSYPLDALGFSFNLFREAKRDRVQVLHYASYYSAYFAASLVQEIAWPVAAQYTGGSLPIGGASRRAWRLLLTPVLRLAKTVLVGPYPAEIQSLQSDLAVNPRKISEFHAPVVDTQVFREIERESACRTVGFDDSSLNLLAVTFIPNRHNDFLAKDPYAMLETFEFVHSNSAKAVALHIVGFGPGISELEDTIRQKGLSSSVFLHGRVEHSRLPLYYSACDLVFLPYPLVRLNEGSVTAEAFSCSRPVVAFKRNHSSAAEQPGGFLIDKDKNAGGSSIVERIRHRDYLARKGAEGLRIAAQYSAETSGKRLVAVYEAIRRKDNARNYNTCSDSHSQGSLD